MKNKFIDFMSSKNHISLWLILLYYFAFSCTYDLASSDSNRLRNRYDVSTKYSLGDYVCGWLIQYQKGILRFILEGGKILNIK